MNVAKYQAMHGVVGNAPSNAVMDATAQSGVPRMFYGSGSPNSVLLAGNGRYNASQGGWVYNVLLVSAGTGYSVGDTITLTGGTKTTPVIVTIDSVASGVIQEWHVSQAGVFTVYPTAVATQGSTSGSGTGATFWLNTPPPDLYVDLTTITAPVLWICTVAGTASGSTWQKVSGGGGGTIVNYDTTGATAYSGGTIAFVASQFTLSGITVLPGTYALLSSQSTPASPTGNQIPQIPVPTSGTIYWVPIAAGLVAAGLLVFAVGAAVLLTLPAL